MAKRKPQISSLADAMSAKGPEIDSGLKYVTYSFHSVPNLYLSVWQNGSRKFHFKMTFLHETTFIALGALGEITLPDAVQKAQLYRQMIQEGLDPRRTLTERRIKTLEKFCHEYFEDFIDQNHKHPKKSRHMLKRWILPVFGHIPLKQIDSRLVSEFVQQILTTVSQKTERRISGSTAKQALSLLSKLFQCAIDQHLVDANPCDGVRRPKVNRSRERYLSSDEYPRFIKATMSLIDRPQAKAIMILAVLGLRPSEVLGLAWCDVHLIDNRIHIKQAKNGESRFVTLNSVARDLLQQLYDARKKRAVWVFPSRGKSSTGHLQSVSKTFERICNIAELPEFNLYDLRRSHATFLLQSGVDLFTIKEALHHKTLASTMVYARVSSESMVNANELAAQRALEAISGQFEPSGEGCEGCEG